MTKNFKVRDFREKNIKIKALEVVQGLCMLYEDGRKTHKNAEKIIEQIYQSAHVSLGDCKNPHKDWFDGLNEIHESLKGVYIDDRSN